MDHALPHTASSQPVRKIKTASSSIKETSSIDLEAPLDIGLFCKPTYRTKKIPWDFRVLCGTTSAML